MVHSAHHDPDRAWLATLTVLYIEDDDDTRALLSRFLRRRVGLLIEAADGAEGLERFQREHPALIITDVQMPKMDGLTFASEVRRLDAHVPIIVTTAFEQVEYLRRAIDVGVDKYVTKPVDTDKLEAALLSMVRGLRAEAILAAERQRELDRVRAHEWEAIGMLAGGMAHDFNNLLQSILSNIELSVPAMPPDTEECEMLEDALASAQQAADLGRRLLTLSSGWPLDLRASAVEPLLRAATARALSGSSTSVQFRVPHEVPPVLCDPALIGRAFASLAVNAREAMADAGILTVDVSVHTLASGELAPLSGGRYVAVRFQDTGVGIAAEHMPKLFDPYFSTKPRTSARGTGLSLALCFAICKQHHGLVTASSRPGAGAAFTVWLPAAPPVVTPQP